MKELKFWYGELARTLSLPTWMLQEKLVMVLLVVLFVTWRINLWFIYFLIVKLRKPSGLENVGEYSRTNFLSLPALILTSWSMTLQYHLVTQGILAKMRIPNVKNKIWSNSLLTFRLEFQMLRINKIDQC